MTSVARDSCTLCPSATHANHGLHKCVNCETGKYAPVASEECRPCSPGEEPSEDQSRCVSCARGTFSAEGRRCEACENGTVASAGSSSCELSCEELVSFLCSGEGVGTCAALLCPLPTLVRSIPAGKGCVAGQKASLEQDYCEICPAGYKAPERASRCERCESGWIAHSGAKACSICEAGYFAPPSQHYCEHELAVFCASLTYPLCFQARRVPTV